MALTNLEKQAWLVSQGQPKSMMYFMTGPNLGPDWNWDIAVTGGYNNFELDEFFGAGGAKYTAHKSKSKKKTSNPGGPAAPGTNCASTAAKNIVSWVAQVTHVADDWWTQIGSIVHGKGAVLMDSTSFRKQVKKALKEAIEEVAEHGSEVIALKALDDLMALTDEARVATTHYVDSLQGSITGNKVFLRESLEKLQKDVARVTATKLDDVLPAADVLNDLFVAPKQVVTEIYDTVVADVVQQQRLAVGAQWKTIIETHDDLTGAFFGLDLDTANVLEVFDAVDSAVGKAGQVVITGAQNADDVIKSLALLDDISEAWVESLADDFLALDHVTARQLFKMSGELGDDITQAAGSLYNTYTDLGENYKNIGWWDQGPTGTLEGSPLEAWAQQFGKDTPAHLFSEVEQVQGTLESLSANGVWHAEKVADDLVSHLNVQKELYLDALEEVIDQNKKALPGFVPTKDEVLETLGTNYVASIKASGTDELNPLVQELLDDQGDVKTLTYFMTKEQKVDLVLLPKETFDQTNYVITWKGQQLEGKGLATAKQKYAIKNGKQAPGGVAPSTVTGGDDVLKAAVNAVEDVDAQDVAKAVKAAEQGGTTVKASATPSHVSWDEPHTYSYVGDGQSKWGGAHRKWHFTDEAGDDWMLKHGVADFRLEGELAAHRIGHVAGFDVAEGRIASQTVAVEGRRQKGFMQKMYRKDEVKGELADFTASGSFVGVSDDITAQVQQHQVLDWLIGNHDGHKQNFLVLQDGSLVGIDKGQAFKFYGKDRLAHDYTPPGNHGEVSYNRMWREYRDGKIDLDLNVIDDALKRIEAMDETQLADMVREYAIGRFGAGGQQAFLQGTSASSPTQLIELVLERKRQIRKQFTEFYQDQAAARGVTWKPVWEAAPKQIKVATSVVREIKPGEIMTPITDDFVEALGRAGSAGKPVYVAGSEVENGQILFDLVTDSQGNQVLRVNAYLRPDADKRMLTLLREESGGAISYTANAPLPSTPQGVREALDYSTKTVAAAKNVNYHIGTGDFTYNSQKINDVESLKGSFDNLRKRLKGVDGNEITVNQLDDLVESLGKLTGTADEIEMVLVSRIDELASHSTQLKAIEHIEPHVDSVIKQAAAGDAAAKVGIVPDFDAVAHYEKVKDVGLKAVRAQIDPKSLAKHVEVVEPEKVFLSVKQVDNRTYQIAGGGESRIAPLRSDGAMVTSGKGPTFQAFAEDGAEVIYRQIDGNFATHQGWLEVVVKTDGKVTTAEIEQAYDLITKRMGVSAKLATPEEMELTYWRVLQGTYRFSKEGTDTASKYYQALQLADDNVRALGANPTTAQEIEAIKGAWRTQFGKVIDDADVLPIQNHALAGHAEEISWAYFEKPELGDLYQELNGKIIYHQTTYGDGTVRAEFFEGATGDAMMAQQVRQQVGFTAAGASVPGDIASGGANGFFARLGGYNAARPNSIIMNPARVHRKMGSYNASHDTFGRLEDRVHQNTLSPRKFSNLPGNNEMMIRDGVSWMDDVEIAFFDTAAEASRAHQILRGRGITLIRGVPIEERFLYHASPSRYAKQFFESSNMGRASYADKLRRKVADILTTTRRKAAGVAEDFGKVVSRLKTRVSADGVRTMSKKLTAGRQATVNFYYDGKYATQPLRYHNAENSISLSLDQLSNQGIIGEADFGSVKELMDAAGIESWAATTEQKFKIYRSQYTGDGVTIDLAPFGVDLQTMSQYERPQVLREFVSAVTNGTLDDFTMKYGGGLAA